MRFALSFGPFRITGIVSPPSPPPTSPTPPNDTKLRFLCFIAAIVDPDLDADPDPKRLPGSGYRYEAGKNQAAPDPK
jgi:hypothetical protein